MMSFFVISEPIFNTSSWHKNIMDGLIDLQRKKRLTLEFLASIKELERFSVCDNDVIFIIGTNSGWLSTTIIACNPIFDNRIIVLGNHRCLPDGMRYSSVMADTPRNITILYSYLKFHGKNRIALYGINPESASDNQRKECFLQCGGSIDDFFYTNGSLSKCFDGFSKRINDYDAVICVNDYAALSIIRHLSTSDNLKKLFITSCGTSLLARLSAPSITHTHTDYKKFADAAYELYRLLQKNSSVNSVTLHLSCNFVIGETTEFLPAPDYVIPNITVMDKDDDLYYTDSEIKEMMKAETLLITCDNDDLLIIERLLDNCSFSKIADELFLSQSTIKYKIKKMYKLCDVKSKEEFVSMLSKYIKVSFDD